MVTAIASLLAMLDASSSSTCNLKPAERPKQVQGYHEMVETCLLFPPRAMRFAPDIETELIERINAERADIGVPPLMLREPLRDVARFHSLDLAWTGAFGHEGSAGRTPFERIAQIDRTLIYSAARENVSRIGGDIDPGERVAWIHDGLMDSVGHRENILSSDITHVAVGVVQTGDRFLTTQVFAAEVASLAVEPPFTVRQASMLPAVTLDDYAFTGFAFEYDGGETVALDGSQPLREGPGRLVVMGWQNDPSDTRRYYTIAFPGPAVEAR